MSETRRLGRYELISLLGRGGMGEVYEAVLVGPRGFRKPVALKVLPADSVREKHRKALVREARLGAMLSHPNVVSTLELGEVDGRWFVAMELVRGVTASALARERSLPAAPLLDLGIQACAGLAHIHGLRVDGHAAGLVHRDIKAANLLVDRSGLVKIADLGIARLLDSGAEVAGTIGYMPPEQADGRADARSDLFALGVTLVRLATGRRPFGKGREGLVAVHRVETLIEDAGFLGSLDAVAPGLGGVVRRCLRLDPDDRWPSAGAVGEALRALRAGIADGPSLLDLLAERRPDVRSSEAVVSRDGGSSWDSGAPTIVIDGDRLLPRPDDAFVGRAEELAELTRAVRSEDGRLFTLHGPGGAGKTRLALELAHRLAGELDGGAVFCDCAEAVSTDGLYAAVAAGLDVPLERDEPLARLGHALLARGRSLLVLDNLEQVLEPAAEAVRAWLERAPELVLLCTSRRPLSVRAERVLGVGPLTEQSAVRLLQERTPRELSDDDESALGPLVDRLDRLPLAIELAAARLRVLSVRQLTERLDDRFRLLAGGSSDGPARHRSLRASLDASWSLLRGWECGAMVQLCVFADGIDLQAAEAVLDLERWPLAPWTLDVLSDLVDQALLRFDSASGRFSMLQAVQEYAREQATDDALRRAEERHGDWFAQLGSPAALRRMNSRGGVATRQRLGDELENVMIAARRARRAGRPEVAAATALAAWVVLGQRGPLAAGLSLLQEVRAMSGATRTLELDLGIVRARVLLGRAEEARALVDRVLERARAGPDRLLELEAQVTAANVGLRGGEPARAQALVREAIERAREVGAPLELARALGTLAALQNHAGRYEEALALDEEALTLVRRRGDTGLEARLLLNIGLVRTSLGDREGASRAGARSIVLLRQLGEARSLGLALSNRSLLESEAGHLDVAHRLLQEASVLARRTGDRFLACLTSSNLASLELARGELERCQVLLDAALQVCRDCHDRDSLSGAWSHRGRLDAARGRYDAAAEAHQEAIALAEQTGQRRRVAVCRGYLGQLELERGRVEAAAPLLTEAVDFADEQQMVSMRAVFGAMQALCDQRRGRAPDRAPLEAALGRLREDGREQYLAEALVWWGLALQEGDEPAADPVLDEAEALARASGAGERSPLGVWLARAGRPLV